MRFSSLLQKAITIVKRGVGRETSSRQHILDCAAARALVSWPPADAAAQLSWIPRRYLSAGLTRDKVVRLDTSFAVGYRAKIGAKAGSPKLSTSFDLRVLVTELQTAIIDNDKSRTGEKLLELRQFPGLLEPAIIHEVMLACQNGKGKSQVAKEVMEIMKRRGVKPHVDSFISLIKGLCRDRELFPALALIQDWAREQDGFNPKPTIEMLNLILDEEVHSRQCDVYASVLQFIAEQGLQPNTETHAHILLMVAVEKDRMKLRNKWAEIVALYGKQPPIELQSAHVRALAKVGSVWEARLALEEMKSMMNVGGRKLESGARRGQVRESGEEDVGPQRKGETAASLSKLRELLAACEGVLTAGVAAGDARLVKLCLLERRKLGLGLRPYSYKFVLKMLLRTAAVANDMGEVDRLVGIFASMKMKVDADSGTRWLEACCRKEDLQSASDILNSALREGQASGANNMLRILARACVRLGEYGRAEAAVAVMNKANLRDPIFPHTSLSAILGDSTPLDDSNTYTLPPEIAALRTDVSATSFHFRVWATGQEGNVDQLMKDMRWAQRVKFQSKWPLLHVFIYNTAIHACCRHRKMEEARELVEMMRADGLPRDSFFDTPLDGQLTYDDADLPSTLTILAAVLLTGGPLDLFTFNFLIQVVSCAGDLAAGLDLLSKMEGYGIRPDCMTLRTLLFYSARRGQLNVMKSMMERMHQEGLAPDTDECLAVIGAYAKRGMYDEAMRAADVFRSRTQASPSEQEGRDGGGGRWADGWDLSPLEEPRGLNFERLKALLRRDKATEARARVEESKARIEMDKQNEARTRAERLRERVERDKDNEALVRVERMRARMEREKYEALARVEQLRARMEKDKAGGADGHDTC